MPLNEAVERAVKECIKEAQIELICKKLRRGMPPEKIAQELEENEETIRWTHEKRRIPCITTVLL